MTAFQFISRRSHPRGARTHKRRISGTGSTTRSQRRGEIEFTSHPRKGDSFPEEGGGEGRVEVGWVCDSPRSAVWHFY